MRFSWTGLILAPLLVPLVFSAGLTGRFDDVDAASFFVLMLAGSCAVSYGVTIFLFMPGLFLLSMRRAVNWAWVCLLGFVLGGLAFIALSAMAWWGSGPNSGPPIESFGVFFRRWLEDPFGAIFPLAGVVTAGLYWWLGRPQREVD